MDLFYETFVCSWCAQNKEEDGEDGEAHGEADDCSLVVHAAVAAIMTIVIVMIMTSRAGWGLERCSAHGGLQFGNGDFGGD